jgi:hypothetical protein
MRPENIAMKAYLQQHGIKARVKYVQKGSLRGTWQLYNPDMIWSEELTKKLGELGFRDFDGQPLGQFSGNGGVFSVNTRQIHGQGIVRLFAGKER